MANEGSTKPTYSDIEAENLRVRGLLQRALPTLEWAYEQSRNSPSSHQEFVREDSEHLAAVKAELNSGAESADIGKLDRVDKKMCADCLDLCDTCSRRFKEPPVHGCAGCSFKCCGFCHAGSADKSGVEMGKVNRVEETWRSTKWTASEPLDYDAHVVKGFIEVSAPNDACFTALFPLRKDAEDYIAWKNAGSAETGGEKA